MFKKTAIALAASAAALAGATGIANAASVNSSTFTISADIAGVCTVDPPATLDFGGGGSLTNTQANTDAQLDLSVTCSSGLPYKVAVNYGLGGGTPPANAAGRVLKHATLANTLSYQLYSSAGRTNGTEIADSSPANSAFWISPPTGTGLAQTVSIYGRIPAQSTPPTGLYSDTVTATIVW